ncbi:unnamed protein product [Acanthoscelides obtectus]|uniref:Uncharacterized protein n=1 Tax=Acanthoscelides obtectus TaxID=200917 RepID=A0A9P0P209_ACAOB|nr:unnamed protein product [Acanthoscelides obtectus]CAK1658638.1 hypothetical protein AOBTE_LOCUS21043 [Acanthoscelides obtectus]
MDKKCKTGASTAGSPSSGSHHQQQGVATLVVMLAVLGIIILFCCLAAPGIRGLCKRFICRTVYKKIWL